MEHKKTMIREYADVAAFRLDEQKLGQQGWSVDMSADVKRRPSLLQRIMARFVPVKDEPIVVTYSRPTPS